MALHKIVGAFGLSGTRGVGAGEDGGALRAPGGGGDCRRGQLGPNSHPTLRTGWGTAVFPAISTGTTGMETVTGPRLQPASWAQGACAPPAFRCPPAFLPTLSIRDFAAILNPPYCHVKQTHL